MSYMFTIITVINSMLPLKEFGIPLLKLSAELYHLAPRSLQLCL